METRTKSPVINSIFSANEGKIPQNTEFSFSFNPEEIIRKYEKGEGNLQKLALSVDELETFTGLDFFHNLDDRTEQQVEAVAPLSPESRRYWWSR